MTTKNELLEVLPMDIFGEFINRINFENLDKFVKMLVAGYISRRGHETVKREIDADSQSDTSNFLTHIIEVGSLKIMQESGLMTQDINKNEVIVVAVALSLNISMATALKSKDVYDLESVVYYTFTALESIFPRIFNHISNAVNNSLYVNDLVNNYLLNKI